MNVDLDAVLYLCIITLGLVGFGVVAWFAADVGPHADEPERHGDLLLWETERRRFDVTCVHCEALFVDLADLDAARAFILANLEGVPGHYCVSDDVDQRRLDAMADGAAQARDDAEGKRWWAA